MDKDTSSDAGTSSRLSMAQQKVNCNNCKKLGNESCAALCRECGLEVDLEDVPVHSLVPEPLREVESVAAFMQELPKYDGEMAALLQDAEAAGECLRFVGGHLLRFYALRVSLHRWSSLGGAIRLPRPWSTNDFIYQDMSHHLHCTGDFNESSDDQVLELELHTRGRHVLAVLMAAPHRGCGCQGRPWQCGAQALPPEPRFCPAERQRQHHCIHDTALHQPAPHCQVPSVEDRFLAAHAREISAYLKLVALA